MGRHENTGQKPPVVKTGGKSRPTGTHVKTGKKG
jgi:hypothetical protein